MSSKEDPTKWTLSKNGENYYIYADRFTIGQYFLVPFKKHKYEKYYCFSRILFKGIHEINHFIQKFMPFGTYDTKMASFKPFTTLDELNKILYEQNNVVIWNAFESIYNVGSITIEPTNDSFSNKSDFMVTLTVFIKPDSTIYQAIALLLAFLDSDKSQQPLPVANYVLSVNQCLNKHIGLDDLSSIIFDFLLIR